jgi:hypothetical protein
MYTVIEGILNSSWLWGGVLICGAFLYLRLLEANRKARLKRSSGPPRPIVAFVVIFSFSFLMGLVKIRFHAWRHTTLSSWALISLLLASFAAYRESSRRKQKSPTTHLPVAKSPITLIEKECRPARSATASSPK